MGISGCWRLHHGATVLWPIALVGNVVFSSVPGPHSPTTQQWGRGAHRSPALPSAPLFLQIQQQILFLLPTTAGTSGMRCTINSALTQHCRTSALFNAVLCSVKKFNYFPSFWWISLGHSIPSQCREAIRTAVAHTLGKVPMGQAGANLSTSPRLGWAGEGKAMD